MSQYTRRDSRSVPAIRLALVARAIGGGATTGYAKHNPDFLPAQTTPMEGSGRGDHHDVTAFGPDGAKYVFATR